MTSMSHPIIMIEAQAERIKPPQIRVAYHRIGEGRRIRSTLVQIDPDKPRLVMRTEGDCDLDSGERDEIKLAAVSFFGRVFG